MGPQVEARARESNLALRRVDIESWNSPVARDHGIDRLPSLWLYENGELVSTDLEEVLEVLF